MPGNQASQVFYGTIPLILVILGVWFREQMLLKDIPVRLSRIEGVLDSIRSELSKIKERLTVLETRAGVVFHE